MNLGLGLSITSRRRVSAPAGPSLGPELVVNGGFDDASAWTVFAPSTISGGVLDLNILGEAARQFPVLVTGAAYRVVYQTVDGSGGMVEGGVSLTVGGTATPLVENPQVSGTTYTADVVCGDATLGVRVFGREDSGGNQPIFAIDNVSVRRVLA